MRIVSGAGGAVQPATSVIEISATMLPRRDPTTALVFKLII